MNKDNKLPIIIFILTITLGLLSIIVSLQLKGLAMPEIFQQGPAYPSPSGGGGCPPGTVGANCGGGCSASSGCDACNCPPDGNCCGNPPHFPCSDEDCPCTDGDPSTECGGDDDDESPPPSSPSPSPSRSPSPPPRSPSPSPSRPPSPPPVRCNAVCDKDTDCPAGLRCATQRCRNPNCPQDSDCVCAASPSPSLSPSPGPNFSCIGLGPQPSAPQRGQRLTFTCRATAQNTTLTHFNFRVNNGTPAKVQAVPSSPAGGQYQGTYTYTIPASGNTFTVQCQVCRTDSDTDCTAWGQAR